MTAQILKINTGHKRDPEIAHNPAIDSGRWIASWLFARGHGSETSTIWESWPPLESATMKLARIFGENLKTHDGKSLVGQVVSQALLAFRAKKVGGAPIDRAAKAYIDELLSCGDLIVTNRVEAQNLDGSGDLMVWDPSVGKFDEWLSMLPDNFQISVHSMQADDGEYAAGRAMVGSLILSPSEYSRLFYPNLSAMFAGL